MHSSIALAQVFLRGIGPIRRPSRLPSIAAADVSRRRGYFSGDPAPPGSVRRPPQRTSAGPRDFKKGTTDHLKAYIRVDGKGFINTREGIEGVLESNIDMTKRNKIAEEVAGERRAHVERNLHAKMNDWIESLAKVGVKT